MRGAVKPLLPRSLADMIQRDFLKNADGGDEKTEAHASK